MKDQSASGPRHTPATASALRTAPRTVRPGRPPASEGASLTRILNGTLQAIIQRGIRKLSMNDIAEAAGVSRGTLYRYFPTKEDALEALAEHVSLQFERGVVEIARDCQTPERVLEAVLQFHFAITVEQQGAKLMEIEPHFLMKFLASHLRRHVAAMTVALAPFYDQVEHDMDGTLDRPLCSETLIRLQISTILVPGTESWNRMPSMVLQLLGMLLKKNRPAVPEPRRVKAGTAEYVA